MPTDKQQFRLDRAAWDAVKAHADSLGYNRAEAVRAFCAEFVTGRLDAEPWLAALVPGEARAGSDGDGLQHGQVPSVASG